MQRRAVAYPHHSHVLAILFTIFILLPDPAHADWVNIATAPLNNGDDGRGAAFADIDGDGDLDLYLVNSGQANVLFRNDAGTWIATGLIGDANAGTGVVFGDFDNDGDLDIYHSLAASGNNRLYENDGTGAGWTNVAAAAGVNSSENGWGSAWGDINGDGYLDLYTVNGNDQNKLYLNNGDGTFTDTGLLTNTNSSGRGVAFADIDNDCDLDLYVVNDGADNRMFRNEGEGTVWVDIASGALANGGGAGQGAVFGDIDNDGDLDLYLSNDGSANKLFRNDGPGTLVEVTTSPLDDPGTARNVAFADVDNDGDLDLHLVKAGGADRFFRNEGDGVTWVSLIGGTIADGGQGRGATFGDIDGDGDLDLYLTRDGQGNRMFRNDHANGNHWLHVNLEGSATNQGTIGARVRIVAGGTSQIREISGGSGYLSQDAPIAAFGLGANTTVDSVLVHWPGERLSRAVNVTADQVLTFYAPYESSVGDFDTLYVSQTAMGLNDGSSWADAHSDLRSALVAAAGATQAEVWVAAGVYLPSCLDRTQPFPIAGTDFDGARLYGGFDGTELTREDRDPVANPTILSGDIGVPGDSLDNSYHVVFLALSSRLDGFTVRDGVADGTGSDIFPGAAGGAGLLYSQNVGGGVIAEGASVFGGVATTMAHCHLVNNTALFGGALYTDIDLIDVVGTRFEDNFAGAEGGAVYVAKPTFSVTGYPTLDSCTFTGNAAPNGNGGAVAIVRNSQIIDSRLLFRDCVFEKNNALSGGVVHSWGSEVDFERCQFDSNTASFGGCVTADSVSVLTALDCDFEANRAFGDGGACNVVVGSDMSFVNSRFFENVAEGDPGASGGGSPFGGGAIALFDASADLTNCTIVRNELLSFGLGDRAGGIFLDPTASVDIVNSILWGNLAPIGNTQRQNIFVTTGGTATVNYTDIGGWTGGLGGVGNFGADPLFVDEANGDLHQSPPSSPVFNAGDNTAPNLAAFDLDGAPRIDGAFVDLGVYEPVITEVDEGDGADALPRTLALHPAAPNPFNPTTRIRFDLPAAADVRLEIYDVSGRRVRTLFDARAQKAGAFEAVWNGRDNAGRPAVSGVYFVRMKSGAFEAKQKVVLVR